MQPNIKVNKLVEGLGFGHGTISREAIEGDAGEGVSEAMDAALHSPEALVPVDKDEQGQMIEDDGCGDGRPVGTVHRKISGVIRSFSRSFHRPKVFGGGVTMATSIVIGLGLTGGKRLQDVFTTGRELLKERGVDYGAHTANTVKQPTDSGCGAIDKASEVLEAAIQYKKEIRAAIEALGVGTIYLNSVEANFAVAAEANRGQEYSGRAVMDDIVDDGKIVKELVGPHIETRIILNMVEGHTVNQKYIRDQTGGKADVFAVDVWRIKQLAEKLYPNDQVAQQKAFLSELVYTLATAGVLTKGDLPVYIVTQQGKTAAQEAAAGVIEPRPALQSA